MEEEKQTASPAMPNADMVQNTPVHKNDFAGHGGHAQPSGCADRKGCMQTESSAARGRWQHRETVNQANAPHGRGGHSISERTTHHACSVSDSGAPTPGPDNNDVTAATITATAGSAATAITATTDTTTATAASANITAATYTAAASTAAATTAPLTTTSPLAVPRAVCDVCPRHCRLAPGRRGACFVRSCHADGLIYCDTYGVSSGFAIDPIEKKPLNHFLPGTTALSFGTAGCNSACQFCQNWELSAARSWSRLGSHASPVDIAEAAASRGARSVAFTYNDPIVFAEYAIDTADACRERGVHPIAVSAGYMTACAARDFYAHMDAANIDLKGFTEDFYRRVTGTHLAAVLRTIEIACATPDCWVELTTLLIPGLNDDDAQLYAECAWIREHVGPDVPLHFSAFHPAFHMMDEPPTPPGTLTRARRIALDEGLHFVYTGNVRDAEGATTYCPGCGEALVARDWFRVTLDRLSAPEGDGRCPTCGQTIPGVWK
ncbi:MAG: AmmeMemoRadiSam system radical SAM enzyme [Bifidobacteriaceae bacterium]|nr:AmmeMemoRadiSam system radical SAM enzyme [Bifidobacteriaceae bacterium]